MNNGFIVLHRKILDHPIWRNEGLVHLFITLLLLASHKEERFLWNGKEETLKRGQLITGRLKLAEITNSPPSTIRDRLKVLENLGILDIKSTSKFSLITIIKYSQYQDKPNKPDSTPDIKPTSNRHQTDTYNNVNNDNNNTLVAKPPSQIAREFFSSKEKQEAVIKAVLEKYPTVDQSFITKELNKFIQYWTAPTQSGRKQLWETKPTFVVNLRFGNWLNNIKNPNKGKTINLNNL